MGIDSVKDRAAQEMHLSRVGFKGLGVICLSLGVGTQYGGAFGWVVFGVCVFGLWRFV
jgi:hypothetical protein